MFAVIKTGGKQYVVHEGDVLNVERIEAEDGQEVIFDQVLLIEDGKNTFIGTPVIENAQVKAVIVKNFKDKKVLVFKKKRRKQYKRMKGHRQELTQVRIEVIMPDKKQAPPKKEAKAEEKVEVKRTLEEPEVVEAKKEVKKVEKKPAKKEAKPKAPSEKKAVTKSAAKPKKSTQAKE